MLNLIILIFALFWLFIPLRFDGRLSNIFCQINLVLMVLLFFTPLFGESSLLTLDAFSPLLQHYLPALGFGLGLNAKDPLFLASGFCILLMFFFCTKDLKSFYTSLDLFFVNLLFFLNQAYFSMNSPLAILLLFSSLFCLILFADIISESKENNFVLNAFLRLFVIFFAFFLFYSRPFFPEWGLENLYFFLVFIFIIFCGLELSKIKNMNTNLKILINYGYIPIVSVYFILHGLKTGAEPFLETSFWVNMPIACLILIFVFHAFSKYFEHRRLHHSFNRNISIIFMVICMFIGPSKPLVLLSMSFGMLMTLIFSSFFDWSAVNEGRVETKFSFRSIFTYIIIISSIPLLVGGIQNGFSSMYETYFAASPLFIFLFMLVHFCLTLHYFWLLKDKNFAMNMGLLQSGCGTLPKALFYALIVICSLVSLKPDFLNIIGT